MSLHLPDPEICHPRKIKNRAPAWVSKLVSSTLQIYAQDKLKKGKSLDYVSDKLTALERDVEERREVNPKGVSGGRFSLDPHLPPSPRR